MAEVVDVLLRARMEASGVEAGVGQIQKSLQGLTLPKGISNELEKSFSKLTPLLKDYQKQLNKGFSNKKDLQNFNALKEKISETFGEIRSQVQSVNSQNIRLKVDTQEIDKLENQIVAKTAKLQDALSKVFTKSINTESVKEQLDKVIGNTGRAATIKPMANMAKQLFNAQDYAAYNAKIDEIKNKILSLSTTKVDLATALGVKDAAKNIDVANDKVEKFFTNLKVNEGKVQTIEHLKQELQELGVNLENVKLESLTRGASELQGLDSLMDQLSGSLRDTGNAASDAGQSMVRMVDEVNELKTSTQYFFSLRNMINLLKRGIDDAVQSVKELDKAMTETAVVTDYKVSDLWGMLPEYTKVANELGATTQGAYETMTLYYQQGLNQQQAFELGAETMKMARIAGLDYAETTDMMTAALRGFNMELDEISAKRVNDVYSKLAAVTASDTEELGTAMQRTASIAHSAGMSFEGTTAFLAQAIETTREPAENIGTAMKTIVARFQEMKKNPLEITEVDGEEVSYNKVDQALQSIGVSLKDTNGQFRELDQVFLDISSRWDSLSQVQQRYIATTAAGSRQQSRFIAMMDNYDRTMQLMEAATDSAGASDEQFGKTMDSLKSKSNKLHNAWQAFTMGIANNDMIKLAVDGLTGFLTITNKIIDTLSLGSGVIKSFLSVFAAFTGLKTGGKAINALIGGLGGLVDPQKTFKEGLKTGFFGSGRDQLQADRISNPIVKAINGLIPHIDGTVKSDGRTGFTYDKNGSYNAARKNLNQLLWEDKGLKNGGKYNLNNIRTIFDDNQLTKEQQKAFFRSSPGLTKNIAKNLGTALEKAGAQPEVARGLAKGFQKGEFSLDEILLKGGLGITADERYNELNKIDPKQATEFRQGLLRKGIQRGLKDKQLEEYIKTAVIPTEAGEEFLKQTQQLSIGEKVTEEFGKAGAAMTSFGSTLQMVGTNLAAVNPQLGQFVSGLGNMMTTAGSAMSALSSLANPIVLVGAAIGTAIYLDQKRLQGIRDAADKVTESYKNIHDQTTENINNLKSYQNEFASLVQGVDKNGNNVNLDTAQYDRYLEIVDEIARLNPAIVEGYNAQGHAIITNNEALTETLKLQQQLQDEATKKYLEDDSLDKLIKARDINSGYVDSLISKRSKGQIQKTYGDVNSQTISQFMGKQTALSPQAMAIGTQIKKSDLYQENKQAVQDILGQYGITLAELEAGEQKAVNVFKAHSSDIKSQLVTAAGIADVEFSDKFNNAFDQWDTSLSGFNESIEGIYQNLSTSISSSGIYDEIDTKLRPAFQASLKDIAATGDSAKQMKADATALATEFSNLTNSSSDYSKAMEQVTQLQDQFASDLDADAYQKAINANDGPIATLNEQLELLKGRTDAAAQAEREFLENEIDSITKFTESSFGNLSSALNTLQDDIAEAEGAFEAFSEATKSDYSTAVKGMQSIYDKLFEETDINGSKQQLHTQGYGDKTFWTGAEAILGKDAVSATGATVNSITKQLKKLEPALQQGEEGYYGFLDLIDSKYQNANEKTKKQMEDLIGTFENSQIQDFHLDQENFAEVARLLGMSENSLTSMLHNAMQFADLDFMDSDAVRKTLATSNESIAGQTTTNGNKDLYVNEEYLRQQVLDAGYRPEKVEGILTKLESQGIKTIPSSKELGSDTAAFFKNNLGVNTQKELIETLNATGTFNREQIADYAKNMMGENVFDPKQFAQDYNDVISSQEHPIDTAQLNELTSINSIVANILANMDPTHNESVESSVDSFKQEVDTTSQYFAQGLDTNGNKLTSDTFDQAKQNLVDIDEGLTAAINKLKIEKQAASQEQQNFLQQQIEGLEQLQKINQTNLSTGEQVFNAAEKAAKAERARQTLQDKADNRDLKNAPPNASTDSPKDTTVTKKTNLTAEDNASPVIEEAQDKADQFDGTESEAEITANSDVEEKASEAKEALNDVDGTTATTTIETETKQPEQVQDSSATVSITGDSSGAISAANGAVATINGLSATITIKGNKDSAIAAANAAVSSINAKSASVKVTAYYDGTTVKIPIEKEVKASTGGYISTNHSLIYRAKGGTTLFKPKGTDTVPAMLTPGEYVQQRSAVEYFGTDFMKYINHKDLPGALASLNKTVYRSSGGSVSYYGDGGDVHGKLRRDWRDSKGTNNNNNNNNKNSLTEAKKALDKASKKVTDTSKKAYGWWAKMERHVKNLETASDRLRKKIDKMISDLRMTTSDFTKVNSKYQKMLNDQITTNQKMVKKATSKLKKLDTNKATVTAKVENSKGKPKNKKFKVGKFIKKDKVTGEYEIDRKAWNKVYNKKGKGKEGKALLEALEKELDKWTDRKNTAQDNVDEANDALQEFKKDFDDMFYGWENELTKIYTLTKDIELLEAKIANEQKKAALSQAKIKDFNYILGNLGDVTGRTKDQPAGSLMAEFNKFLASNKEQLKQTELLQNKNRELLAEYNKEIEATQSMNDDESKRFAAGLQMDEKTFGHLSEADKRAYAKGVLLNGGHGRSAYYQNGQFDSAALEADHKNGLVSKELYEGIKEAYDKITEAELNRVQTEGAILDAEADLYDLQQERIQLAKELYEQLYGWKNELNKIFIYSQKIADAQARTSRYQAQTDLMESKLTSGMQQFSDDFNNELLGFFKANLDASGEAIENSWKSIQEQTSELSKEWSSEREKELYVNLTNQYNDAKEARYYQEQAELAKAAMNAVEAAVDSIDTQQTVISGAEHNIDVAAAEIKSDNAAIKKANKTIKTANTKIQAAKKVVNNKNSTKKQVAAAKKTINKQTDKKTAAKEAKSDAKIDRAEQREVVADNKATIQTSQNLIKSQQAIIDSNTELASHLDYYSDQAEATAGAWIDDAAFAILEARQIAAEEEVKVRDLAHRFLTATQMGDGTMKFDFDSEGFEALRGTEVTTEMANRVTEYVKKLIDDAAELNNSYTEITNRIKELYDGLRALKETMADNAESLLNAYTELRSKEINRIKTLVDSINSSLKDLLDQVKKSLDERRRQEDNAKTETTIGQQQNRLAAMRANTASGNQVTIAQLQKELADSQQSYGRTLEDQLIQRLQEGADAAYKQRQRQITLLSGLLEVEKITGRAAAYIESLIDNEEWGVIRELKTTAAETSAMTRWQKDIFGADLESFLTNIALFEEKRWATEKELEEKAELERKLAEAQKASQTPVGNAGYTNSSSPGTWNAPTNTPTNNVPEAPKTPVTIYLNTNENNKITVSADLEAAGKDFVNYVNARDAAGKVGVTGITKMLEKGNAAGLSDYQVLAKGAKTDGLTWKKEFQALANAGYSKSDIKNIFTDAGKTMSETAKKALKNTKFAAGGLADFTGPAWLDGTPSKPELVLNATDTKNFIALKDVLSRVMKLQNSGDGSLSNANFEINVNVDHISSDYDVDKLTERIKRNIVKDASYRNVTQARRMR